MKQAKKGDTVKVHYTGKLGSGFVFDTSNQRDPIQFTIGEGVVLAGFEEAVEGMNQGEAKTIKIAADDAYGTYRKELVVEVKRSELPQHLQPKVGQRLHVTQPNEQKVVVTITEVTDSNVTLDANHPLAGQDLTFDIHLVEIA
jgi:FKBP-type peptidyl-prolyl cis-trans isomerase 2